MFTSNNPIIVGILSVIILMILISPFFVFRKHQKYNIIVSLYVLAIVFVMRLAVTLAGDPEGTENLNFVERVFDSFVHALQTFSMDEGYTEYTRVGKEVLTSAGYTSWAFVYGLFISFLNILAPIIGGALLLDILTGLFPSVRLFLHPFKHKYVFSELNEMSIALAEDIYAKGSDNTPNYKQINSKCIFKPLIIFTDAYVDDESEVRSELLARAKKLRAICVKTDLLDLCFIHSKTVTYLLIDSKVEDNITTFSKLAKNERTNSEHSILNNNTTHFERLFPVVKENSKEYRTRMYVFIQEEHEAETIHRILDSSSINGQIAVRAIRDYMNAAINLMVNVPLFLPLLYTPKNELTITILGSGSIAQDVFKTIYWCGQMNNIALKINIVSKDATQLEKYFKEHYSEMMKSCEEHSDILKVYESGVSMDYSTVYSKCTFQDIEDVTSISALSGPTIDFIKQTDYYVIALGSDELNHSVTSRLNNELLKRRLNDRASSTSTFSCPETTFLVPAIFNSELADAIRISKPNKPDSFIMPFATFRTRFSCQNVFFASFISDATSSQQLYNKHQQKKWIKDEYTWMANVVKEVHAVYKLFSIGKLLAATNADGTLIDITETSFKYISSPLTVTKDEYDTLAWLEHRRWNAFLRSQGFSFPDWSIFERYSNEIKTHKNIRLKYHPCLVECKKGRTVPLNLVATSNPTDFMLIPYDRLDYTSSKILHDMQSIDSEFVLPSVSGYKAYDYYGRYIYIDYQSEISECIPVDQDNNPTLRLSDSNLTLFIKDFIDRLSQKEKHVFLRHFWYRDSVEVIASDCHYKVKKVNGYLKNIMESLSNTMGHLSNEPNEAYVDTKRLIGVIHSLPSSIYRLSEKQQNEKPHKWQWEAYDSRLNSLLKPQPIPNDNDPWIYP